MKLCDINVLVYAHRQDSCPDHELYADWLIKLATRQEAFALSEAVLAGFIRIVTNPRIFADPTPVDKAIEFCENLKKRSQACLLKPGDRNWAIFENLCQKIPARGKLVADAWHAALAIEYDCEWISADGDFARFPGLKWSHPLKA